MHTCCSRRLAFFPYAPIATRFLFFCLQFILYVILFLGAGTGFLQQSLVMENRAGGGEEVTHVVCACLMVCIR